MNAVVEKLAAIEKEIAAIQPKMQPITERIDVLDQKVAGFAQQLTSLAEESAAVKQDIELTRQCLTRIQTLIGESKAESEQLVAGQEENLHRCETMTAVFGAAFQAMSQFFETAQRMGLADQAKAVFLTPSSAPATLPLPSVPSPAIPAPVSDVAPAAPPVFESPVQKPQPLPPEEPADKPSPPIPEAVAEAAQTEEPIGEEPVNESSVNEESVSELPPVAAPAPVKPVIEPPETASTKTPTEEPVSEEIVSEPATVPPAAEPSAMKSPAAELPVEEPILSESDFDSVTSGSGDAGLVSWSVPGLPDVAAPPEMETAHLDSETPALTDTPFADAEPTSEMASHLDVPPLNLDTPALPEQTESPAMDEKDEQEIEAMLATMMAPVTVGS